MFFTLLLILCSAIIYLLVIKPIIPMIKLKLQHGKSCLIKYHFLGGELWDSLKEMRTSKDYFQRARNSYLKNKFKISVSNFLWTTRITIADPEYYKIMLLKPEYYEKGNILNQNDVIQKGLVFSMGNKWKQQRTLLGTYFEFDQIKKRLPMMNQVSLEKLRNFKGENILELLESITGEIVIQSFFGVLAEGVKINNREIQIEIADLLNELGWIRFKSKFYFLKRTLFGINSWKIFPTQHEKDLLKRVSEVRLTIEKLIQKRIFQIELKIDEDENEIDKKESYFLDILINEYLKEKNNGTNSITIDEIIQQFITLQFAGTDTTAVLIYHCLYFFALHPEAQNVIREEVKQQANKNNEINDLNKLVELQAFINEVMRVKNPAIRLAQRVCNQTHYVKDLKIEKGWSVAINYMFQCCSDDHYDNPEQFNYKRWLQKEPIKNNNNFIFIPFSAGPRNCIGQHMALMEAKIILSQILLNYNITINEEVDSRWMMKFVYQLTPYNCVKLKKMIL